ncbi:hypothetical protein SSSM5_185 [Synechococcus phage S-SSM5]|uniref:Uncharacterized protein n=1 Tax=Synechococcus phage S-SSM5 TaxID=445685 RepID=E3SKM5_9CAUD|nr:major head protein [Synechococcus phage S-SSM5]ADO97885.1 hypothetical protein SSSM5_185 [Synechococcus phage S-SSM5]
MMTAGTGGFSGSADAKGPVAGFDPVMKFRKKIKKKKVAESKENPTQPSRLFQYKVNVPEVGETIIYANSPAELQRKLRMVIMPQHRSDISIERVMPAAAGQFFMNKRMKHMRNVQEQNDAQMKQQQAQMKIGIEKKKVMLKKQELQKQLQAKTAQLKKQARAGAEIDATR